MIRIILVSVLAGLLAWYWIAYAKFGDATVISNLRESERAMKQEMERVRLEQDELRSQNDILKTKWKQLLEQNQDYSTMIGQLSRYYYHIQKASRKLGELKAILDIEDDDLPAKLGSVPWTRPPAPSMGTQPSSARSQIPTLDPSDKRFF